MSYLTLSQLNSSMDKCEAAFSSKETGKSLSELKAIIVSITEKKTYIKQATELVQTQGRKLQELLSQSNSHNTNGETSLDLSKVGREGEGSVPASPASVRRVQSSEDILDVADGPRVLRSRAISDVLAIATDTNLKVKTLSMEDVSTVAARHRVDWEAKRSSLDSAGAGDSRESHSPSNLNYPQGSSPTHAPSSPKILVTPKRTRAGVKGALSVPSITLHQNHQVVENLLVGADGRLNQLILLWEGRRKRLEEVEQAMQFREAVPQILHWVDTVGANFLKMHNHYGRSMEEVIKDGGKNYFFSF